MGRHRDDSQTKEFHWQGFLDFSRYELLCGGPDPHMKLIKHMCELVPTYEKLWRIGCYVAVYNVPTAELLWTYLRPEDVAERPEETTAWLREHWKGLHIRRERRPVKSAPRLVEHLASYASRWLDSPESSGKVMLSDDYDQVWDYVSSVKYVGRYAALKTCETLRLCGVTNARCPDLRSKGGWSPRLGLSYLFPEHVEALMGNDAQANLELTDALGSQVRQYLEENLGYKVGMYTTEVLLCDYKQAWHKRQYPGRSHDSELDHLRKLTDYWGHQVFASHLYQAREAVFPSWALGEQQGWSGVRDELTSVLHDHGYTWSDYLYDFNTTTDLSAPVLRERDPW